MSRDSYARLFICGALVVLGGCDSQSSPPSDAPPPPETVRVEAVSDKQVEVTPPTVTIADGVMDVSGYVRRLATARREIRGRVDIDVTDPDGEVLAWIPALLTPEKLPAQAGGEAGYVVHYGWVPPAGSIVKVRFVDKATAVIEDSEGAEYEGATGGHAATPHGGGRNGRRGSGMSSGGWR